MLRLFLFCGSVSGFLAVALGAFGAHVLRGKLHPDMFTVYQTAVQYHFYHTAGLFIVALAGHFLGDSPFVRLAGWLMLAGIVLFSGSLYAMCFSGITRFGAVTPFGGLAFLAAWAFLAIAVLNPAK